MRSFGCALFAEVQYRKRAEQKTDLTVSRTGDTPALICDKNKKRGRWTNFDRIGKFGVHPPAAENERGIFLRKSRRIARGPRFLRKIILRRIAYDRIAVQAIPDFNVPQT